LQFVNADLIAAERARLLAEQTGTQLIVSTPPAKPTTTPDRKSS